MIVAPAQPLLYSLHVRLLKVADGLGDAADHTTHSSPILGVSGCAPIHGPDAWFICARSTTVSIQAAD
jgi:hypothetical protein